MTPLEFMSLAFLASVGAGIVGSILGLGGGIIVVPALTILLGVDIRFAIGASIVSVIATSCGAGSAYLKKHLANVRVAMLLEPCTAAGAILGAMLAGLVAGRWLFVIFGLLMAYTAIRMWHRPKLRAKHEIPEDWLSRRLALEGSYVDAATGERNVYHASRVPRGLAVSVTAGVLSGLLGVGGGIIQVPMMNMVMGLPLKISMGTSSFIIGVTAAASAGVYFYRGEVNPYIAAPVALGVLAGAAIGTRVMSRLHSSWIRVFFAVVLVVTAAQMLWKGIR